MSMLQCNSIKGEYATVYKYKVIVNYNVAVYYGGEEGSGEGTLSHMSSTFSRTCQRRVSILQYNSINVVLVYCSVIVSM